jgi:hypothetical protein
MRTRLLTYCLLLVSGIAAGQIYSWRDADGRVHYGDQEPAGVNARKLAPVLLPDAESERARQNLAKEEMLFKKRQSDAAEAEAKAAQTRSEAAARQTGCEQARAYLRALEQGERIWRSNNAGEREALDDQAREKEAASARRAVSENCN